ncbi:MAG: SH3 domain-containing protein [Aggregatilineales bacterium]
MRFVRLLSLTCFVLALCCSSHLTAAQAGIEMVLQAYNGDAILHREPSLSSPVVAVIKSGDRFIWRADRLDAEGRQWFFVQFDGLFGWISPDDGIIDFADPTAITPQMDRSATFTIAGNERTLHNAPSRSSAAIAVLPIGSVLRVIGAPVVTDLYTWWKVRDSASGVEGWIADTVPNFQVIEPLRVYGYQVCDNFDLAQFGLPGWDSIVGVLPSLLDAGEQVVCLASTKMDGGVSPIVVVLGRNEARNVESLRTFARRGGTWVPIFARYTEPFARTDRLSLHDLTGDPYPTLLWNVRLDGTGSVLQSSVMRFNPATGLVELQNLGEYYKGFMQINGRQLTFFQANYLPGEPNCCPSGVERYVFEWDGTTFMRIYFDLLPLPYQIQSSRR